MLEKVRKIINNQVGIIELAEDLDIETVTEIFIRVNSAGASLSQADFAMSKIAAIRTMAAHAAQGDRLFLPPRRRARIPARIEKGDRHSRLPSSCRRCVG